jgi:2-amino-4-hydroxy-6-hydroxymethyldihydropteridine diphosphokinase
MAKAFIALGSNLGQRERYLRNAIRVLAKDNIILGLSPIYQTEPMGGPEQGEYLNQVVVIKTEWAPFELLRFCQSVESSAGRVREKRFGPRTLDLDILLYDEHHYATRDLTLPHPRMTLRRFMLEPLNDVAPDLVLPGGKAITEYLAEVENQSVVRWVPDGHPLDDDLLDALSYERPNVMAIAEVDSTNLEMRRLWGSGRARHGSVIVSEEQTGGRGRLGRQWMSPKGTGVYFSQLVVPDRDLDPLLGFAVAVALSETTAALSGMVPGIKWPNDGVIGGRKYAGILVEAGTMPLPYAIIGLGINVHGSLNDKVPTATTIDESSVGYSPIDRVLLVDQLMKRLDYWIKVWADIGSEKILGAWRHFDVLAGKSIQVWQGDAVVLQGIAVGIDESGHLLIETPDAQLTPVAAGEVSVRLANGQYAPVSR